MSQLSLAIVEILEKDILDRRGLKQEWRQIDPEILEELRQDWQRKIDAFLATTDIDLGNWAL